MNLESTKELLGYIDQNCLHALLMPEEGIRISYCFRKGTVSFTNDMEEVWIRRGVSVSVFKHPLPMSEIMKMIESMK